MLLGCSFWGVWLGEEKRARLVVFVVLLIVFLGGRRSCSWLGIKESEGKNGGLEAVEVEGGGKVES